MLRDRELSKLSWVVSLALLVNLLFTFSLASCPAGSSTQPRLAEPPNMPDGPDFPRNGKELHRKAKKEVAANDFRLTSFQFKNRFDEGCWRDKEKKN